MHQLDLLVGEWANLLAKDAESANQFILLEHWHDEKAARASDIDKRHNRRIAGGVTRFARDVGDVDHLFCRGDTAKGDVRAWAKYRVAAILLGPCGRRSVNRRQSKCIRFIKEQIAELGLADARGILKHGLEHRLQFAGRRTYDLQHFGRRRLLLQQLGEIVGALAQLVEQPRILDGDDGLGGEVSEQRNLLFGKRPHLLPVNSDGSDQFSLFEHGHQKEGSGTRKLS